MAEWENYSSVIGLTNYNNGHEYHTMNVATTPTTAAAAAAAATTTTTTTTTKATIADRFRIVNDLTYNECHCFDADQQFLSKKRQTQHSQHHKTHSSCTFCHCSCYCHAMARNTGTEQRYFNGLSSENNSMSQTTLLLEHDCCLIVAKTEEQETEEMNAQEVDYEIDACKDNDNDNDDNNDDYEYEYNDYVVNDYNSLRYSFKGIPPELYSAKKEFIYTRPLVQQQLVLKKTCEWWFYKIKCYNNNNNINNKDSNHNNMSTYWKQNSFLIFIISIITLLGIIIFFCLPLKNATHTKVIINDQKNSSRRTNNSNDLTILNYPIISIATTRATTTTTTTTTTINPSKITAITELTRRANVSASYEFPALHDDNHQQYNYTNQSYNHDNSNNSNNNNNNNNNNNIRNIHNDNDSDNDIDTDTYTATDRDTDNKNEYENKNEINDWNVNENDENVNENDIEEDIHGNIGNQLTIDYVIPIKMVNFSLSLDDLLYESKRNLNIHHYNNNNNNNNNDKKYFSSYKLTGTFRNTSSQIWDPHPEYILNVFGHRLHLILHQDVSFIPLKTFRVINILDNMSEEEIEEIEPHYLGCYYKGYIEGDNESAVSVSLCHGMTGYIKTSFGTLLIQPVNQETIYDAPSTINNNNSNNNKNNISHNISSNSNNNNNNNNNLSSSKIMHKVWRHSGRNARHAVSILDLDLNEFEKHIMPKNKKKRKKKTEKEKWLEVMAKQEEKEVGKQEEQNKQQHIILSRRKRDYYDDHRTIELLLGVDRTMKEFHKHNLNSYVLMLMSIVSNVFADASIGNVIHISVVNILVLNDYDRSKRKPIKGRALLRDFCYRVNARGYHYDTAMLLTRNQICSNRSSEACDAIGLAEVGTICRRSSCSIVQDNGLSAAFTIVHELGHILNVPHDDSKRCENFNMYGKKYIMSSMMSDDIHPWSWSDCSRHYILETLEREDKSCLHDTHGSYIHNYNRRLPGEIYSLDDQCKLIHGNTSRYCAIEIDCKRLWCKIHDNNSDCRSSGLPWAEGTPCNDNTFWCQKGDCVPRDLSIRPMIHGGWGPWSPFTDCSLPCGGGVQKSTRECNNPKPQDGGKYCSGAHKKYRSCNTHNCPSGSRDAREEQCYQQKFKNHNIPGVPSNANWIPKYGLDDNKMCSLYCRLENGTDPYNFGEVIDGTVCSLGSTDKCVNGVCRPAGCDNELNSMAKLDKCGVCEGRNDTCEEFTGNFYVSDLYKVQPKSTTYYYYVTTIPKDASNIVIEQPGYHQENYIVLRDDQGKTLLNGDGVVPYFTKYIPYAGVLIEYNGSNNFIERVNTTYMARLKRDLRLEIISLTTTNSNMDNDTLLMTYTYTISKPNYMDTEVEIYRWEMQQWSICDALCQGSMHRMPVCVSTVQVLKVAPQFCDAQAKPQNEYRPCNTDCILTLNLTNISECSAQCGALGKREKSYACIQTFPEVQHSNTVDIKYCLAKFEFKTHEECREGCWQYNDWSTCTKSCGYGLQTRTVGCYFNQTFVHDDYCNLSTKADYRDTSRVCNQNKCQYPREITTAQFALSLPSAVANNNWRTGEWGKCNENCIKTRTVKCRNPSGHGCPIKMKPPNKRKCCVIKYVSNWSQCSTQCGNGVRRKEFHCARVYKPDIKGTPRHREFIDTSYCRHLAMPKARRREKSCKISCKWSSTQWTHCSADCTNNYQTRSVYCETMHGNLISNGYCDETKKPEERRMCSNCIKREYKIVASCNCEGYRKRRLICYDPHRRRVPCPMKEKIIREKCTPPRHCYPTSCHDIQRFHRTYENGEYTIYVRSLPKKIYCHDMNSSPKEYLTVNAIENYSIYYDNKTTNPDECPPESRSKEYRDDSLLLSGRTTFHKIRIDLPTLRVYENDFTFADTRGKAQAYGSAGDCYNRRKICPQGDFSINLEQTGFRIRHGTVWETYGHHVVIKESNSNSRLTHRALCGGWCGGCKIASNSALYIDV